RDRPPFPTRRSSDLEAGYYSMWIPYEEALWNRLRAVKELPVPMTLEAVTTDPHELERIAQQSKAINDMIVAGKAKDTTDGFSGRSEEHTSELQSREN